MFTGSSFHSRGAAAPNAESPTHFFVMAWCSVGAMFWRRRPSRFRGLTSSARKDAAKPFMHLKVVTNILKAIRLSTASQCSSFNTGVMWSCLLVRVISCDNWLHCSRHAVAELSVITGCYAAVSCSSRVER